MTSPFGIPTRLRVAENALILNYNSVNKFVYNSFGLSIDNNASLTGHLLREVAYPLADTDGANVQYVKDKIYQAKIKDIMCIGLSGNLPVSASPEDVKFDQIIYKHGNDIVFNNLNSRFTL